MKIYVPMRTRKMEHVKPKPWPPRTLLAKSAFYTMNDAVEMCNAHYLAHTREVSETCSCCGQSKAKSPTSLTWYNHRENDLLVSRSVEKNDQGERYVIHELVMRREFCS